MAEDPYDVFVPTKERIAAPFTVAAETYLANGFFPTPVKGKSQVLSGVTGARGVNNEGKVRKQLISRSLGYDNLAIRHDGTIAIDADVYNGKLGQETLEEFRVEHGLSSLPPTFSSTSRGDDSPSRQYFFRLRSYVKLESKPRVNGRPADDVEICQYHHRFSVVYPSVHPDTGAVYTWYLPGSGGLSWGAQTETIPHLEDLPFLPDDWIAALLKGEDTELDLDAEVTDASSLISSFRDGEPSTPVRTALEEAATQHPGHDETMRSLYKAFMYGREGHPGVKQLVGKLIASHRHYLETEHPERAAKGEVESIIRHAATRAQQSPVENPYRPYSPLITLNGTTVSVGPGVTGGMAAQPQALTPLGSGVVRQPAQSSGSDWDAALEAGMVDEAAFATTSVDNRFLIPDWVWEQSVELATIRKAALSRMVSPDAVLHAALATIASTIHHESNLETGRGPTVLSYYVAAVGQSGGGKTEALNCAEDLMEIWRGGQIEQLGKDGFFQAEIGSGEGMVEAYMGTVKEFIPKLDENNDPLIDDETEEPIGKWETVRRQIRHNVMFVSDEGRQVLSIAGRSGSTLMSTLCSMWSGTSTGASNAKAENSRKIAKRSYVLGLIMGFQPATMEPLFEDAAGGAPQRFIYASAEHPDISVEETDFPEQLSPKLPPWSPIRMTLSDKHRLAVRTHTVQKNRGELVMGQFDGHRMLLQCRTAALLAMLHSQTSVSDEMWDLAEVLVSVSCEFRDDLAGRAQRQAQEAAERKAQMQVQTTVASAVMVERNTKLHEIADLIAEKVGDHSEGEMTRRDAKNAITKAKRAFFDEAVTLLVTEGRVTEEEIINPDTNRKVAVIRLTGEEE